MTVPYFARLLCLSLASFFLANLVLTAMVWAVARRAVALASGMRPREGARLLFALRLAPAALSSAMVVGLCVPSYFWLEPETSAESLGWGCLAAAVLGAATFSHGITRTAQAGIRSSRYLRNCEQVLESDAPVLMLAGIFRSRLLVSRGVRRALTPEQLSVAVRHERAHGAARDNLKRLLLLLAPDAVPFVRGLGRMERGWSRLAEWAADDRAVNGSRRRSLALASALVRVARMGASPSAPLTTSLLGTRDDLAARVERLLEGETRAPGNRWWPAIAVALAIGIWAVRPGSLVAMHRALEAIAH